jgi:hypothetical protein
VALPLGGVGVLLIQEGIRAWRPAAAGACAVAVVDMAYAAAAVAVGPILVKALSGGAAVWVRLVSAAVLAVIAAHGLLSQGWLVGQPMSSGPAGGGAGMAKVFVRFGAVTAINPMTAVYFTALAAAQGNSGKSMFGLGFFLAGVFAASLIWQLVLVTVGALMGSRVPASLRAWTFMVGYALVGLYAIKLALTPA